MFKPSHEANDKKLIHALKIYSDLTYYTVQPDPAYDKPRQDIIEAMNAGGDCQVRAGDYKNTILTAAVLMNDTDLFQPILQYCVRYFKTHQKHHTLINTPDGVWHNTPLLLAIKKGNYPLALQLINEFDADVNQGISHTGLTPLHLSVALLGTHQGQIENEQDDALLKLIYTMLEKGADPNAQLTIATGDRPLDLLSYRIKEHDFRRYYSLMTICEFYQDSLSKLVEDDCALEEARLQQLEVDWTDRVSELNFDDDPKARLNFEVAARNDVNHPFHDAQLYNDFISTAYTYEEVLERGDGLEKYIEAGVQKCENTVPLLLDENCYYHRENFKQLLCEDRSRYLEDENNTKAIDELRQALQKKSLDYCK